MADEAEFARGADRVRGAGVLGAMQDELIEDQRVANRKLRRRRRADGADKGIVPVLILAGKHGHVLADGSGFLLYASTPEHDRLDPDGKTRCYGSARRWNNIKHELAFATLTQDGDDEGIHRLGRLPTETEAEAIRDCLGIRKRRHLSPEELERLRFTLAAARAAH